VDAVCCSSPPGRLLKSTISVNKGWTVDQRIKSENEDTDAEEAAL
jgi:hypothetical protein